MTPQMCISNRTNRIYAGTCGLLNVELPTLSTLTDYLGQYQGWRGLGLAEARALNKTPPRHYTTIFEPFGDNRDSRYMMCRDPVFVAGLELKRHLDMWVPQDVVW